MIAYPPAPPASARYPRTTMTFVESIPSQMTYLEPWYPDVVPQYVRSRSELSFGQDPVFEAFIQDVVSLKDEEGEDAPPTEFSISEVLSLTPLARILLAQRWKEPHVETDGYGGIRLSWRKGDREVRTVIPGDTTRRRYLYWDDTDQYGSVTDFTATTLYTYLDRLQSESSHEI